jgi:AcrR family transcriptional regulator
MSDQTPDRAHDPTLAQRVRTASRKRRDGEREHVRERLMQAAAEVLLDVGYEAFSLRKVAERAGFTATTIYRYFADKDALVLAVTDDGWVRFERTLRDSVAGIDDPFKAARAQGRAYIRFGLQNPVLYRLMFMQRPDLLLAPPQGEGGRPRVQAFEALLEVVRRIVASGRSRRSDVGTVANYMWAAAHGVVALVLSMKVFSDDSVEALTELTLDAIGEILHA